MMMFVLLFFFVGWAGKTRSRRAMPYVALATVAHSFVPTLVSAPVVGGLPWLAFCIAITTSAKKSFPFPLKQLKTCYYDAELKRQMDGIKTRWEVYLLWIVFPQILSGRSP